QLSRASIRGGTLLEGRTLEHAQHEWLIAAACRDMNVVTESGPSATLCSPFLCAGRTVGGSQACRYRRAPSTARPTALLQMFADPGLVEELGRRNRDGPEAVEQQTATAEILNVIATSPTDSQPVLDVVVERARLLSDSQCVILFVRADDRIRVMAKAGDFPGA